MVRRAGGGAARAVEEDSAPARRLASIAGEVRPGRSLDSAVRALKDELLRPVARRCARVPPNAVTLAALAAGLAAAAAAAAPRPALALALWAANRGLDALDGSVARANGTASDFGGYLDIVCDFVVYAALPLARCAGVRGRDAAARAWPAACAFEGVCFVNAASLFCLSALLEKRAAGAAARGEATSVTMIEALVGGFESAVLFLILLAVPDPFVAGVLNLFSGLVAICVVQRLVWARTALR